MKTKKHRENLIKMACIYYTRWAHKNSHAMMRRGYFYAFFTGPETAPTRRIHPPPNH